MNHLTIGTRRIGPGESVYIIAEMSANHGQDKAKAIEIIHAMKEVGADAVKIQTYTPDTMTLKSDASYFTDCLKGTLWEGQTLHSLYGDAYTPWEWQAELQELSLSLGMDFFSTAYDFSSVEFLESIGVSAYKIASFELIHLPLIRRIAETGKPIVLSTGMASVQEIQDAVDAARAAGAQQMVLLKCTSAYPAKIEHANLRTIPAMAEKFDLPVGLSDHTMGHAVPVTAITQGACIVEKHFVLDREADKGPDSTFSMEPQEFKTMVDAVRAAERDPASAKIEEAALGDVHFGTTSGDKGSTVFRPSIFVCQDVKKGEQLSEENIRIVRPGHGLAPKHFDDVLGKTASKDLPFGTPLTLECIEQESGVLACSTH